MVRVGFYIDCFFYIEKIKKFYFKKEIEGDFHHLNHSDFHSNQSKPTSFDYVLWIGSTIIFIVFIFIAVIICPKKAENKE